MSDSLVPYTEAEVSEALALSDTLRLSQVFPKYKSKEQLFAIIAAGRELGLPPMQALRSLHFYEGRVSLSSDLMLAMCMKSDTCEYIHLVESTATECTYKAKRRAYPEATTITFSIKDAQTAGLAGKENWKKYPKSMLRARCAAEVARAVFPDLMMGCYDSESEEIAPVVLSPSVPVTPECQGAPPPRIPDATFEPVPPANDELTMAQKLALSGLKVRLSKAKTHADIVAIGVESSRDKELDSCRAQVAAYTAEAQRKVGTLLT